MSPVGTMTEKAKSAVAGNGEGKVQVAPNPFVRASREVIEGAFDDQSQQLVVGSTFQKSDIDVPAFGFISGIVFHVTTSGGVGGGANVQKVEDAPWSVLRDITFSDVNGKALVGPFTGYDLYLINKWGAYGWALDPASSPIFSDVATGAGATGHFTFMFRLPIQVSVRDALGALPNENANSTYKVNYTIGSPANVYATAPATTQPTVRVRLYAEFWAPPDPADPRGRPNDQAPPAMGTTQHWTKRPENIAAGEQTVEQTRKGNMIRTIIYVLRTAAGVRTTADFPETFRLTWDKKELLEISRDLWRHLMWERSGQQPDTGVLVLDFQHDLDGRLGNEMRDQWLPTTTATRMELEGVFGANASSIHILTNDVAPTEGGRVFVG